MFAKVSINATEKQAVDEARIGFMNACPFYAQLMISLGEMVATRDLPTAATDGKRIFYNPDYFCKLKPMERVFVLAHEMSHFVKRHPQRFKHYANNEKIRELPWDQMFGNVCADYVINAELIQENIGSCNPDWLYRPDVKPGEVWEDVYERLYQPPPPPPLGGRPGRPGNQPGSGGTGSNPGNQPGTGPVQTYGQHGGGVRGQKGDKEGGAQATGQGFDTVLEPSRDPQTGQDDLPDEAEFIEAVARAYAMAKAMGNVPGFVQRLVDELLTPQVDWRDHIRMLVTGKIGSRHETWARPNRRRLVTQPVVIIPGKRGFGAERVVVGVDTSGSITEKEYQAFWSEVGGVLNDCRPREIVIIGCDMVVHERFVHTVSSLDELDYARMQGLGGGGGTSFIPVFDYVQEHDLKPEALIYLTDMMGSFPHEKPAYPVIWCATTELDPPWGEVVRIKVED